MYYLHMWHLFDGKMAFIWWQTISKKVAQIMQQREVGCIIATFKGVLKIQKTIFINYTKDMNFHEKNGTHFTRCKWIFVRWWWQGMIIIPLYHINLLRQQLWRGIKYFVYHDGELNGDFNNIAITIYQRVARPCKKSCKNVINVQYMN